MARSRWQGTTWKKLGDGTVINVPAPDEPHQCELTLSDGTGRAFCFATREHVRVLGVKVDGMRYVSTPDRDWDSETVE